MLHILFTDDYEGYKKKQKLMQRPQDNPEKPPPHTLPCPIGH